MSFLSCVCFQRMKICFVILFFIFYQTSIKYGNACYSNFQMKSTTKRMIRTTEYSIISTTIVQLTTTPLLVATTKFFPNHVTTTIILINTSETTSEFTDFYKTNKKM